MERDRGPIGPKKMYQIQKVQRTYVAPNVRRSPAIIPRSQHMTDTLSHIPPLLGRLLPSFFPFVISFVPFFLIFFNLFKISHHQQHRKESIPHPSQSMASLVESGWQYLITHFTDFQLATLGSFIIHESVFFLSGLPSVCFERFGLFSKYKIQKKNNTPAAQERCILRLILYHLCVNLPVMILSYPAFRYMGLKSSLPLPHWTVILSQIAFYFVIEDFIFYWGHRILHTKWLYKHVHSVHHEYATPFGLTSEYAHPAEILFLGFATIIGPALTGPHLFTLWLWMTVRVLETVEAHSGYHFPWSPSNFLPLYGGAEFHDFHHRVLYTKSGNYASTFIYMDRLFGTDRDYRKQKVLQGEGKGM